MFLCLSLSRLWRQLPHQREPGALPRQKIFRIFYVNLRILFLSRA